MKKKIIFKLILFIVFTLSLFGNDVVDKLFALPKGNIAYYEGAEINAEDYQRAEALKSSLLKKGARLYSILIVDVLPASGNEFVAVYNDGRESFAVFSQNGASHFTYNSRFSPINTKGALEIREYDDGRGPLKVINYYVLNNSYEEKTVTLFLFQIRKENIKYVTEIKYYKSKQYAQGGFTTHLENTFADVNGDGVLELLVAKRTQTERRNTVQYQMYKYDYKRKIYAYDFELAHENYLNCEKYFREGR